MLSKKDIVSLLSDILCNIRKNTLKTTYMDKVKTLDDLRKMRETFRANIDLRERSDNPEEVVRVKVSMATCGIASGAKDIMNYFIESLNRRQIDALVTQTGCMGYCYAEPTAEIILPGKEPLVFGYLTTEKVDEIINQYVLNGILVDGIMPITYDSVKPE